MALKLKYITSTLMGIIVLAASGMLIQSQLQAEEADVQAAIDACENITLQQRQMAKAAGYDVDSLCSAAKNATKEIDTSRPTVVVPRSTTAMPEDPEDKALEETIKESNDAPTLEEDKQTKVVEQTLEQFGYDLFAGTPTTFAPATEIPVVSNYMIGPGDNIKVQLFGKKSDNFTLTVSRDGIVQFPELGPITLAGLTFMEMKRVLTERVEKQMIGAQINITLGELRSIQIFILGDASRPGSYTVSSLSSMTNALFVSGGVRKIGSLRNIQLKRKGEVVTTLDLYDLLLKGDTTNDVRLLPGDVIFIPPVGKTAGVAGEVKRPAIYELKNEQSVDELVIMAGGYLPSAYPEASRLERINKAGERTLLDVDLNSKQGATIKLANGDVLQVYSVLEKMEDIVLLEGHVYRPGGFSFKKGMRVSDLLPKIDTMLPVPDLDYALLIREMEPTREMKVLQIHLRSIFEDQTSKVNVQLQARDRLIIFAANQSRDEVLIPIIETLRTQERLAEPIKIVTISGAAHFPGIYPLTDKMSVRDLVFAGGGLKESTYVSSAEITRKDYSNPEEASIKHFSINLQNTLSANRASQNELLAGDHLTLKLIPKYQEILTVSLLGEIKFPGVYEFTRGETLSEIVERAGGLTDLAHVEASYFSRVDLKRLEAKQIADLQERLKGDIAATQLEDTDNEKYSDVATLNTLLDNLKNSEPTGRLVINLSAILGSQQEDIQLRDGDQLVIPTYRQEVTIIGEVQNPTSYLYNQVNDYQDYINLSGGTTEKGDSDRIYIIKANGSVFLPEKSGWFHDAVTMAPGDTIVVPVEVDKLDHLSLWTSVSQIIYQMALGAAALKAL